MITMPGQPFEGAATATAAPPSYYVVNGSTAGAQEQLAHAEVSAEMAHDPENDPEFEAALQIAHDLVRAGDAEGLETVAGRPWVSRELDAALVAAWQAALDGNIVFLRWEATNE